MVPDAADNYEAFTQIVVKRSFREIVMNTVQLFQVIHEWKPDPLNLLPDGFLFLHGCAMSFLNSCPRKEYVK